MKIEEFLTKNGHFERWRANSRQSEMKKLEELENEFAAMQDILYKKSRTDATDKTPATVTEDPHFKVSYQIEKKELERRGVVVEIPSYTSFEERLSQ